MTVDRIGRPLQGKQILLLMPCFFGLHDKIKNELENLGAVVFFFESFVFLEDKRFNSNSIDRWLRILRNPFYSQRYTKNILRAIKSYNIDILFSVFTYSASPKLIYYLKRKNPEFKSYIYFWDAFSTWDFRYQMSFFDYKYSFDLNDCQAYHFQNLEHLPLFWTEDQLVGVEYKYDLVHIGSLHPKYVTRLVSIIKLLNKCNELGLQTFFALVATDANREILNHSIKRKLRYCIDKEFREHVRKVQEIAEKYTNLIRYTPLPLEEVHNIEKQSKCIVDVNMNRAGVAIRIIAALANGQKVITNNSYIKKESFYNPQNIYVIDEKNITIDKNWLDSSVVKVDMDFLRIDNWLKRILRII